jgi:hypothetical protein
MRTRQRWAGSVRGGRRRPVATPPLLLLALILTGCVSEPAASVGVPARPSASVPILGSRERWPDPPRGRALPLSTPMPSRSVEAVRHAVAVVVVADRTASGRTVKGVASRMGSGFGRSYLALPEGPGHRVRICARACWTMTSTDAGPSKAMQREPYNRVADLNDWAWSKVCGIPLSRGLCSVEVTYL